MHILERKNYLYTKTTIDHIQRCDLKIFEVKKLNILQIADTKLINTI